MSEVKVQTCLNTSIRVYHTKSQLTDAGGTCDGPVVELVSKLPGVTDVMVNRYSVHVTKGEAWTWEEVEPGVIEFLDACR